MKLLVAMLSFLVGAGIAGVGSLWSARSGTGDGGTRRAASTSGDAPGTHGRGKGDRGPRGREDEVSPGGTRELPSVRETTAESVVTLDDRSAAWAAEPAARAAASAAGADGAGRLGGIAGLDVRGETAARARALDAEIASGPPSPELATHARKLRASVRALSLPGYEALKEAACGTTACRFQIPAAMASAVRAWLASVPEDGGLLVHQPDGGDGILAVYVRATATSPATTGAHAMSAGAPGRTAPLAIEALPEQARAALAASATAPGSAP